MDMYHNTYKGKYHDSYRTKESRYPDRGPGPL